MVEKLPRFRGPKPYPRVLHSVSEDAVERNAFLKLLICTSSGYVGRPFSWPLAIAGRYDVFHVHWPEFLLRTRPGLQPFAVVLFCLLWLRLAILNTPVVWTVHNLSPHERGGLVERSLLAALFRLVDVQAVMLKSQLANPPLTVQAVYIPHGHYRDYYEHISRDPQGKQLLTFGQIRPYKGLEILISAFQALDDDKARLKIVGQPTDAAFAWHLRTLAQQDHRIDCIFEFVPDSDVPELFAKSTAIVLPYREFGNSGVMLLALSLGVRVLAPDAPAVLELQQEVGRQWISTYPEQLSAQALECLLATATSDTGESMPDLSNRSWGKIRAEYSAVYRKLLSK